MARFFNMKVMIVFVLLTVAVLYLYGSLEPLDLILYDYLMQYRNGIYDKMRKSVFGEEPPKVYVLAKDDVSINNLDKIAHSVQWERDIYAKAIRELTDRGVKVIAVDLILSNEKDPEKDEDLKAVLRECDNVILAQRVHFEESEQAMYESIDFPVPFFDDVTGLGMINMDLDIDNVLREYKNFTLSTVENTDGKKYPHLATAAAALFKGAPNLEDEKAIKEVLGPIPDKFLVNFSGIPGSSTPAIPHIPFHKAYWGTLENPYVEVDGFKPSRTGMDVLRVPAGTAAFSGVILDEEGKPVPGAMVSCFNNGGKGFFITESADDGSFSFDGLPSGIEFVVTAFTLGSDGVFMNRMAIYSPDNALYSVPNQAEETTVMLRAFDCMSSGASQPVSNGDLTISFYPLAISEYGEPLCLAEQEVTVCWIDPVTKLVDRRSGITGAEGDVTFSDLAREILWIEVPGYSGNQFIFNAVKLERKENNLVRYLLLEQPLPGGGHIKGVVTGEAGETVAGAEVWLALAAPLAPEGYDMVFTPPALKTTADKNGRYIFENVGYSPAVYMWARAYDDTGLRVKKRGWFGLGELSPEGLLVFDTAIIFKLQPDERSSNNVLRMFPVSPPAYSGALDGEGKIAGRVMDESDQPIPNVPIWAYYTSSEQQGKGVGIVMIKKTTTDAEGNYSFENLKWGKYYMLLPTVDESGRITSYADTSRIDAPWDLDGAAIFIGPTSDLEQDEWPTTTTRGLPGSLLMAGVEYHAHAFANLVTGNYIHREFKFLRGLANLIRKFKKLENFSGVLTLLLFPVLGIALSLAFNRLSFLKGSLIELTVLFLLLVLAMWALSIPLVWVKIVPLGLVSLSLFTTIYGFRFIEEQREKMRVRDTFQRFVSPEVVNKILTTEGDIRMGGEKREMTVFFSDVRSFTTFSEHHTPEQIVDCLNEYLNAMAEVIFKYEGTLDKFVGDEIMAVWGAPLHQPNHAELAIRCCIEQGKVLEKLWEKWEGEGREIMDMGMGLNTGPMITGAMGANMFMDYTVIGDAVNLGARLEGLTRDWDNYLIISEFTYEHIKDIVVAKPLEPVVVKGKTKPVMIYEVLGLKEEEYRFPRPRVAKQEKRAMAEKKKAELAAALAEKNGGGKKTKDDSKPADDKKEPESG